MTENIGVALDDLEVAEFLETRGLGVLGLARDDEAYTLPIAFAYDGSNDRCILRFVMGADSEKAAFAEATETATLTVYTWESADRWRSVNLAGRLRELDGDEIAAAAALFSDVGQEAALDIFNRPLEEFETAWYEFDIVEMTGRGNY